MRGAALACAILLAGCADGGPSEVGRIGQTLVELALPDRQTDDAPPRQPSRAELDAIQSALIAVSVAGGPRSYVAPVADNGGYLSYADAKRRIIVLRGAAIARTNGLRHDLIGVRFAAEDPLAHPRPLADWPGQVDRAYQFRQRDLDAYGITLTCVFERGPRSRIDIVERRHEVVQVTETCRNQARRVINRHWVAPESGVVWKSEQWIGPNEPPFTIEVVTPYRQG